MKHRGPDSTGYALYRAPTGRASCTSSSPRPNASATSTSTSACAQARRGRAPRCARRARRSRSSKGTTTTMTVIFGYDGDLKPLADRVEDVRDTEVLSLGHSLEIVKDLGDAETVVGRVRPGRLTRHARDRPRADGDRVRRRHLQRPPYWAYPFSDVAVVHNGQLTNYHDWRRRLERYGHRFQSECDSEIIAVYLAERMSEGALARGRDAPEPRGPRRRLHLHLRHRGRPRRGQGQARRPSRWCSTRTTTWSRSPPRRSRSARCSTARSRPTTPTRARCGYGPGERGRHRPMDERGLVELDDTVPQTSKIDGERAELDAARSDHPQDQPRAALADLRAGGHAT